MVKKTIKQKKVVKSKSIKRRKSNKIKKHTNLHGGADNRNLQYARLEKDKPNQTIKCLQCQQTDFVMESDLLESSRWTSVLGVSAFTNKRAYILNCVACKYMMWFREKPKKYVNQVMTSQSQPRTRSQ